MTTLAASLVFLAPQGAPSITDVYQRNFRDATFTLRVLKANQSELRKINKDFGQSYRFETTEVKIKEPFKVRMTAKVEDTNILFVLNGATRLVSIPKIRVNRKENLADEPGKRQTSLDFGLITPALFEDLFVAKFVRRDRATQDLVFDLRYNPRFDYGSWYRVWIDPEKRIITRKEWYRRNRQLATFFYSDPREFDGVWVPTRMAVRNVEDKLAGETVLEDLKVNVGLSEDLFRIR